MNPQQPIDLPREPSLNELCLLPGTGNIAYAVRCGRRMQPRFHPNREEAAGMLKIVENSLCFAEMSLQREIPIDERVRMLVEASYQVADMSAETNDFAAFAAHHAVRGAVLNAESTEPMSSDTFLEIVAAAFGASRVLLSNMPPWVHAQAVAVLRADYDKLMRLGLGHGAERGLPIDPTVTGPLGNLWADKVPTW